MKHTIPSGLLERRVRVALVGAGGNGSQMLSGLARLDRAMRALGHPAGLHVTVWDPDKVSDANVGRQLFSPADVGLHKAIVLVHRLNCFFGLSWDAVPARYTGRSSEGPDVTNLVITCVDSAKARREIGAAITGKKTVTPAYWLDLGNQAHKGQVVLGQPARGDEGQIGVASAADLAAGGAAKARASAKPLPRLPTILEECPELLDASIPEEETPSCSLAEALERQGLFVNQAVVTWGLNLLEMLFRRGGLDVRGYWINLETGHVNPIPVADPAPVSGGRKRCGSGG